ncbi:hypothetical protein JRC49_09670 [Clostridiales bacterium FE2011]|nr:hypothetical protein JRC49_09670 [Clostridiales bacterium FE2011]
MSEYEVGLDSIDTSSDVSDTSSSDFSEDISDTDAESFEEMPEDSIDLSDDDSVDEPIDDIAEDVEESVESVSTDVLPEDIIEDIPDENYELVSEDDYDETIKEDFEDIPEDIEMEQMDDLAEEPVDVAEPDMEDTVSDAIPEDAETEQMDDLTDEPADNAEPEMEDTVSDAIPEDAETEQMDDLTDEPADNAEPDVEDAVSDNILEDAEIEQMDDLTDEPADNAEPEMEDTVSDAIPEDAETEQMDDLTDEPADNAEPEMEDTVSDAIPEDAETEQMDDQTDEPADNAEPEMEDTVSDNIPEDAETEQMDDLTDEPVDNAETDMEDTVSDAILEDAETEQMDDLTDEPTDNAEPEMEDTVSDAIPEDAETEHYAGSHSETNNYETVPEKKDTNSLETVGEKPPVDNQYRERWENFGKEFIDVDDTSKWDTLKDVPFAGDKFNDASIDSLYETSDVDAYKPDEKEVSDHFDAPRASDLCDEILHDIPQDRQNAIDMAYRNAPHEIVDALNDCASDLKPIEDTGYSQDEYGRIVKDGCYYSPDDKQVRMDERLDNDEYAEIVPHELSHFLDHERGWESRSSEFVNAIASDLNQMDRNTPEGRMRYNEMLDDAFNTGAAYDRNVSDIMNGVFKNDPEMAERFLDEGVPRYTHQDEYWAIPNNREAETYANMGAILCSDNRISNGFLERYYPTTYNQFKKFYGIS